MSKSKNEFIKDNIGTEAIKRVIELESQLKEKDALLKEAIKEMKTSVAFDLDSGVHTLAEECEPELQRLKSFQRFLAKDEVKKIMDNKEK